MHDDSNPWQSKLESSLSLFRLHWLKFLLEFKIIELDVARSENGQTLFSSFPLCIFHYKNSEQKLFPRRERTLDKSNETHLIKLIGNNKMKKKQRGTSKVQSNKRKESWKLNSFARSIVVVVVGRFPLSILKRLSLFSQSSLISPSGHTMESRKK